MFLLIVDQGQCSSVTFQEVRGQKADSVSRDHLDSMCRFASPMWQPGTQKFTAQRKPAILLFQKDRGCSLTPLIQASLKNL